MKNHFPAIASVVSAAARTVALLAIATSPALAQDSKSVTPTPTVAGTWAMTLMSHPVGLVLEQNGTIVTGTMMMMGTDVKVDGDFVAGVLKLSSNAKLTSRGASEGPGAGHLGTVAAEGTALKLTGKLLEDGTLAGEIPGANGPIAWTAERLKERKVKAPVSAATTGPGLTGAWKMAADSPQGTMQLDLTLKQDGDKVSGLLSSAHSGDLKFDGTFAQGVLKFSTAGTGPDALHLDYRATLKADGTLAGSLTGANVAMSWTAERVKK